MGYNPLPVPQLFAEQLRTYRRMHGLSKERLAERLGVDKTTIWRWESGRSRPREGLRERIEAVIRELP